LGLPSSPGSRSNKMRFLHVSDLHYSKRHCSDIQKIVDALIASVREQHQEHKFDLAFFTGDLVFSGTNREDFDEVRERVISPLAAAMEMQPSDIIICAGNHDVCPQRFRSVPPIIESGLLAIKGLTELNQFMESTATDATLLNLALSPATRFLDFESKHYLDAGFKTHVLLGTRIVNLKGRRIGISVFNSAWRSTAGGNDKERLLLSEWLVDSALRQIKDADIKIAVMHHPFDWLAEFDRKTVEIRIAQNYDFLLCGHVHAAVPQLVTNVYGRMTISQSGALFQSRADINTYQVADVDLDTGKIRFSIFEWADIRKAFVSADRLVPRGTVEFQVKPFGISPAEAAAQRLLNLRRAHIRSMANEHVTLLHPRSEEADDIKEVFVCPPLSGSRTPEWARPMPKEIGDHNFVIVSDVLRSDRNFIIIGGHDSGKTSLGHLLSVLASEGQADKVRIPALLQAGSLTRYPNQLRQRVRSYLTSNDADEASLEDFDLAMMEARSSARLLIIDDFNMDDKRHWETLSHLQAECSGDRWILLCADDVATRIRDSSDIAGNDFQVLYLLDLPRRHIREISRRRNELNEGDTVLLMPRVMDRLQSAGLPRNGYIVSLLAWLAAQDPAKDTVNEAILIRSIVDHLLERGKFDAALRGNLDSEIKEIILSEVANFLRSRGGSSPHNEILEFVLKYFVQRNLQYQADVFLEKLLDCRILVQDEGLIRFRFSCYQSFFFARYLRDQPELLNQIATKESFVEYSRELDLLTALARTDFGLIRTILRKLPVVSKRFLPNTNPKPYEEVGLVAPITLPSLRQLRASRMTQDEIDNLIDTAEAQARTGSGAPSSSADVVGTFEAVIEYNELLQVAGRILRNAEVLDGGEKQDALHIILNEHATLLDHFMTVLTSGSNLFPDTIRRLHPNLGEKLVNVVISIIQAAVPIAVAENLANGLTSRKLLGTFSKVAQSEGLRPGVLLLHALVLLRIDTKSGLNEIKRILDHKSTAVIVKSCQIALMSAYRMRTYDLAYTRNLEEILVDIQVKEGLPKDRRSAALTLMRGRQGISSQEM